jgi:small-conductance mechanosensitive channel
MAVEEGEAEARATTVLSELLPQRTPEPTATPDRVEQAVRDAMWRRGLYFVEFLGLRLADWANLLFSLFIAGVGYLLGTLLIKVILPFAIRRTEGHFAHGALESAGPGLRWLVVILVVDYATERLTFIQAEIKWILDSVYAILVVAILFRIGWRLISLGADWFRERATQEGRKEQWEPLIILLTRLAQTLFVVSAASIVLSALGINISALVTVLGIGGLAFSLAARDTIADAIAGFIVLADRPYRIGDRIEIPGVGTWGDVVDIGLRTTKIRTRDNRMVIVPNSIIGTSQVVNYTYPDPRYRIETHVGVAYGTPIETVRNVIGEAVRTVDHVLPDRPVDVLYLEMGESAMIFRVRWWIESYVDTRRVEDAVHTAMQKALDAAGIDCPYPTSTIRLEVDPPPLPRRVRVLPAPSADVQDGMGAGRQEQR